MKKQREKHKNSPRELMGITKITDYSLVTPYGELVYFIIHPTNISVLSESSVSSRIYALMTVLKGIAEIEMLCLNSKENFDDNKEYSNILVDFDKRDDDKTNPCILILGNSGQGKSYLLKLILCNILESGKNVICLDPEHEFGELAENTGGCFVDLMSGQYMINPLEPKSWDDGGSPQDKDAPIAFRQATFPLL
jgi:hypothetical protein